MGNVKVNGWNYDGSIYTLSSNNDSIGPIKVSKLDREYVAYIGPVPISKISPNSPGDLVKWLNKINIYFEILKREDKVKVYA